MKNLNTIIKIGKINGFEKIISDIKLKTDFKLNKKDLQVLSQKCNNVLQFQNKSEIICPTCQTEIDVEEIKCLTCGCDLENISKFNIYFQITELKELLFKHIIKNFEKKLEFEFIDNYTLKIKGNERIILDFNSLFASNIDKIHNLVGKLINNNIDFDKIISFSFEENLDLIKLSKISNQYNLYIFEELSPKSFNSFYKKLEEITKNYSKKEDLLKILNYNEKKISNYEWYGRNK